MEKELERKIFNVNEYKTKEDMSLDINKYIKEMKRKYENAIVTKEFYDSNNILVRVTNIYNYSKNKFKSIEEKERILELGTRQKTVEKEKTRGSSREKIR